MWWTDGRLSRWVLKQLIDNHGKAGMCLTEYAEISLSMLTLQDALIATGSMTIDNAFSQRQNASLRDNEVLELTES